LADSSAENDEDEEEEDNENDEDNSSDEDEGSGVNNGVKKEEDDAMISARINAATSAIPTHLTKVQTPDDGSPFKSIFLRHPFDVTDRFCAEVVYSALNATGRIKKEKESGNLMNSGTNAKEVKGVIDVLKLHLHDPPVLVRVKKRLANSSPYYMVTQQRPPNFPEAPSSLVNSVQQQQQLQQQQQIPQQQQQGMNYPQLFGGNISLPVQQQQGGGGGPPNPQVLYDINPPNNVYLGSSLGNPFLPPQQQGGGGGGGGGIPPPQSSALSGNSFGGMGVVNAPFQHPQQNLMYVPPQNVRPLANK